MTFGPANSISSYLPIEFQVEGDEQFFRELISERQRLVASVVNVKENGQYQNNEILNAQQWFSTQPANTAIKTRYAFRKVIDFGALPNNATKSVAHGLTLDDGVNPSTYFFTKLIAQAYDPTQGAESAITIGGAYYDIVAGAVANPINLNLGPTTVNITTTSNRTNYSRCYVILEYLKVF